MTGQPVEVERDDLATLLAVAGRYVTQEPTTELWQEWFKSMMQKYAEAAGYELLDQSTPMDAPGGQA